MRAAIADLQREAKALPRRQVARNDFTAAAEWDRGASWPGALVEQRFGGLSVSAPGNWRYDHDERRAATWAVPRVNALVSLHLFGFDKRAPSVIEYLAFLAASNRDGYERVGVRPVRHPHTDPPAGGAFEMFEHDPHDPTWPQRWLRVARWSGTEILCARIDSDGPITDWLGADFARLWRDLR